MSHPSLLFRCTAVLLAGTLFAGPLAAQKHAKRLEREQVTGMDEQWRSAILSDDTSSMDKLLSDDYLGITGTGQAVTKLQQLDRMRNRSLALTRLDVSDVKVKLVGPVAIVTSFADIEGMMDGKPMHGAFRSTRVYQHLPGDGWKLTNFEATRVHSSHGEADIQPAVVKR